MMTSVKSNLTCLKNSEFELLAKCVLIINQLNGSFPPEPITFEKLYNTNLREIDPWWLFGIFPPMFILYSEYISDKNQVILFTHRNLSMGGIGDDWNHRTVFEGDFRRFSLEKILETEYPNLENRKNWRNAIESYAKGLELEIKAVNSGLGISASSYGQTEFGQIQTNESSYYAIQNRARVTAYLDNGIKLFEHQKYPQIQDVSGLDAWINVMTRKPYLGNSCRPTLSMEIANLFLHYGYLPPLPNQEANTVGNSKFNPILAEEEYSEFLFQVPNFVAARCNYINVLIINKKFDEALEQAKIALDYAPEDPQLWEDAGNIYISQGSVDSALKCYQNAIDIDPSRFHAYYNIAMVHRKKGDYQNSVKWALEALKKVDTFSPKYQQQKFNTYYMLAVDYMWLFDFQSEIRAIDACLKIKPKEAFLKDMKREAKLKRPVLGLD
jgi:tetratricopeptide (TPR) repeat protein